MQRDAHDEFVLRAVAARNRLDARTLARAARDGINKIHGADARDRARRALAELNAHPLSDPPAPAPAPSSPPAAP